MNIPNYETRISALEGGRLTFLNNNIYLGNTITQSVETVTDEIVIGSNLTGKGVNTCLIQGKLYTTENS